MSITSKIINSPIIQDPWPHKIIDNVFSNQTLEELTSSTLLDKYGHSKLFKEDGSMSTAIEVLHLHKDISATALDEIMHINKILLDNVNMIVKDFPNARSYNEYYGMPSLYFLKGGAGSYPVHDEDIVKTITITVYLSKSGLGTGLFSTYDKMHHRVEWKQNRALVFCGEKDKTWHDFKTDDRDRVTLNFFIRKRNVYNFSLQEDTVSAEVDGNMVIRERTPEADLFYNLYKDKSLFSKQVI
jgi:hypothetical protein